MASSSSPSGQVVLLVVWLTSSCTTLELGGVVRTMPGARLEQGVPEQPLDGSPLAGATITLRCPGDSAARLTLTSDAAGRFRHAFPDELSNACILRVEKVGYHAREVRVIEACAWGEDHSCFAANLSARLLPKEQP